MSTPHGEVSALVALITNASKIIEAQYAKTSKPYVPSLNDTTPHPLDAGIPSFELNQAIQTLEGACAQLCTTVARPDHTVANKFMGIYEPSCLHVAVGFKIPDILQEKPHGMHISEIAKATGLEEGKVGRVLRLLATQHIFREVKTNVFANNRLSVELLSSNPLSSLSLHFTDENYKATSMLPDVLADPEWGHSYSPEHCAFNKWSKHPGSLFTWYEGATPDGAKQGARFGMGMGGWGRLVNASAIITDFPWASLGNSATVVDVGGGIGIITMELAKAHPNLLLKLQDTPERIQQAQAEVWPRECPEAIRDQKIEFKAMDFMIEPPIKGCDIYYLKNIIHDWPDKVAAQILRGVRDAMKPTSRVLVHEFVIQHADRTEVCKSAFAQAPEPLLPNYGVGRIRHYNLDLDMMVMLNSQERCLEEFIKLGEDAGLSFVKLWDFGDMGAIEFRLAEVSAYTRCYQVDISRALIRA